MAGLGHTLVIANPYSQINRGRSAVSPVEGILSQACVTDVYLTERPESAREKARNACDYETICCIGGDGTAHEVANGILERDPEDRPAFALIPVGSGNDYARTLGMPIGNPRRAAQALIDGVRIPIDVGVCNGEYFLESFSCEFDADIAISTIALREKTNSTGLPLYMRAGFEVIRDRFVTHDLELTSPDAQSESRSRYTGSCLLLCATIGRTYGGGFAIAPDADPEDGLLDICIGEPMAKGRALWVFLRASRGWHRGCPEIVTMRSDHLVARFADEPPIQIDGEPRQGNVFELGIVPRGLEVIAPQTSRLARTESSPEADA